MAAARFYSSTSGAIDLTADVAASDTGLTVSTTSGLPGATPFTLVLDPGLSTEEIVTVTNVSGLTLTVTRGADGSAAQAHFAGVGNVRHMATARDFREPQEHIGASAAVHGVTGSVVGTTDAQTLTNKTLGATVFSGPITGGQAATLGATSAGSVSTSAVTATATAVGSTPVSVALVSDGAGDPTGAGVSITRDRVVGAADYVKITPGATNVFEYKIGNPGAQPGTVTIGKNGEVLVQQTAGAGTAPALTVRGKDTSSASSAIEVRDSANAVKFNVDNQGGITSPTVTDLDGRLDAIEANLGSQTTFAATSAAKDKKRIHWGTASITTDSLGVATVAHGAGFTPSVVIPNRLGTTGSLWRVDQADGYTSTEFQVRVNGGDGSTAPNGTTLTIQYFCGE